ncbi:MAG: Type 1 glutamine amidotransferase-like domain-containing protein [Acidimicrobiia bacterium]
MDAENPSPAGPVALVGSGEFTPAMADVDRLLLEGRPRRAVFLPTAAGREGADRVDYWVRLGREHYHDLGVEPVPLLVLDRESADDPALAAEVAGAGLIYLSGGDPGYLAETLAGTRVLDAIHGAWTGGAALAGCSAGACALTSATFGVRPPLGRRPGLGFIPGLVVLPHFDAIERWWPGIVERWRDELEPGELLVGIDELTALVGGPERFVVHGAGAAWVIDGERRGYPAGAEIDVSLAAPHS